MPKARAIATRNAFCSDNRQKWPALLRQETMPPVTIATNNASSHWANYSQSLLSYSYVQEHEYQLFFQ